MNLQDQSPPRKVPPALAAEAAAWLSILHGPNRTAKAEQGFAQWLKTSSDHARAFEEVTEIWEESRNLPRPMSLARAAPRAGIARPLVALAAGIALAVVGIFAYFQYSGIATGVGEQRVLTLEDGTRVILNTATRVVVSYDGQRRLVKLRDGEALFEVAKRENWPFVVVAGDRQIRALGTTFAVRREERRLAVTLVEGKVAVRPTLDERQVVTLNAGQRVTFNGDQPATLDQPAMEKVLAWQRREVALDDMPLPDAVAEMNRYSVTPLVIERPEAERVHVTGLFRAGDSLSFARAVAEAYEMKVLEEPDRIILAGSPR